MSNLELCLSLLLVASTAVHATIPPVLDGVVTSSSQAARDLCPTLAHLGHHLLDEDAFFRRDWVVVQIWLQVLVESLATLLWGACLDGAGYADPIRRAILVHEVKQQVVFGLRPRATLVLWHCEEVVKEWSLLFSCVVGAAVQCQFSERRGRGRCCRKTMQALH